MNEYFDFMQVDILGIAAYAVLASVHWLFTRNRKAA